MRRSTPLFISLFSGLYTDTVRLSEGLHDVLNTAGQPVVHRFDHQDRFVHVLLVIDLAVLLERHFLQVRAQPQDDPQQPDFYLHCGRAMVENAQLGPSSNGTGRPGEQFNEQFEDEEYMEKSQYHRQFFLIDCES